MIVGAQTVMLAGAWLLCLGARFGALATTRVVCEWVLSSRRVLQLDTGDIALVSAAVVFTCL
jgi:hypothetical protein